MDENKLSDERVGEISLLSMSILWAFFPIISILIFSTLQPLMTAALSTLCAGVFFLLIMFKKNLWHEMLVREAWPDILKATITIGILVYAFYFVGLKTTTAGNASIISLTEVLFAVIILRYWQNERLSSNQMLGAGIMVVGAFMVLLTDTFSVKSGDLFILLAAAIAPFGNKYAKASLKYVSSYTVMFIRSAISGFILLLMSFFLEGLVSISLGFKASIFLFINGALLLGVSKIMWLEGIRRMSVSKATSFLPIIPGFTLIFAYYILGEIPTVYQVMGLGVITIGFFLLINKSKIKQKV